ncbi:MAG: GNAT family N-acetyltransferase [Chloroflexota bacterium]|nr:GNAT family N-acetyltransferase [Chloroflexota bacterium]
MPPLTFRRAVPDEADLLTGICHRAKASHGYDQAMMEIFLGDGDMVISRESIARNTIMMALDGERVVGFAHLMPVEKPETIYLEDLFIEPDVQGRGVGRALFEWALAEARERGYRWLEWDSDPNASPFYQKMGGEQIDEAVSTLIPGRKIPKFRMQTGL